MGGTGRSGTLAGASTSRADSMASLTAGKVDTSAPARASGRTVGHRCADTKTLPSTLLPVPNPLSGARHQEHRSSAPSAPVARAGEVPEAEPLSRGGWKGSDDAAVGTGACAGFVDGAEGSRSCAPVTPGACCGSTGRPAVGAAAAPVDRVGVALAGAKACASCAAGPGRAFAFARARACVCVCLCVCAHACTCALNLRQLLGG